MKTTNMMLAAATLLAAAATLPAETLKAEVPFNFAAASARMQPGEYRVSISYSNGGRAMVQIRNLDDGRAVLALPITVGSPEPRSKAPSGVAVLSFQCSDNRCELSKIWDGTNNVYTFATHPAGADMHIASVAMKLDRGN